MDDHEQIARPRIDPAATPFTETFAYQRYGSNTDPEPGALEALYTKAIIREQGFDGLPHVVTRHELDRYVAAGEVELFRGVTEERFAKQLQSGDFFVGRGGVFDGMYAAAGPNALAVARHYAAHGDGTIVRMTMKRGARIIDGREFEDRAYTTWRQAIRVDDAERGAMHVLYNNFSCFVAYLGYDAINVVEFPDVDQYIVLNRTALRMQKESVR